MDAAILRVLVEVNGVRRATKELRDVNQEGARAARSAHTAAGGFDDVDRSSRRAAKGFAGLAAAAGGGNNGLRNMGRSLDRFGGSADGATATIGGFRIALAALVPIAIGFGGAAVAMGASLGPLIGLAAAAGNAFAAAAQGVGVFKLAIMGIGGALKEQISNQGKAGGAAASNASAQRSAANAITAAQDGVGASMRALSDAQRDHQVAVAALAPAYTQARRALADMQAGVRDAILNEASMALGLRDARKALDELIRGASPMDLADAQDAVADSSRNATRAMLDLGDAQRALNVVLADPSSSADDIARARLALRDAENAVDDARRDSMKAAMDLAELEKPASSDALAEARLRVASAENDLAAARRDRIRQQKDLNAAEAAGISGSKEVVEARENIADAERRVADASRDVAKAQAAVREAQLSAAEASQKAAGGAAALNEEFNKLPPAAQAFVRVLQGMKPKLDELRATAASGFFPGATAGLQAAMGSFSSVNKVVGETSTVLGDAARKSGELVGSPAFGKDIETIGGRNAKVLATLGEALRHVVSALRHVMVAAGPLTQWLADMANRWALNAATAAKAGRENGKLAEFFEKTRAITERLVSIIGHLGSGLLGLGKVGKRTGDSIWLSIDRAAARFDEWANSAKGQKQLHDFFREAKELAAALTPVLAGLSSGIALVVLKIVPLSAILRVLGPYADEATVAFIAFKTATIAIGLASKGATAAMAIATFATGGWTTAFWALNAALFANPIGLVVVAIAALVAGLVIAWKNSETFRDVVTGAFKAVTTAFGWILNAASHVFGWLKSNWPQILQILTGPIGLAVAAIKNFGPKMLEAAKHLLSQFTSGVRNAADAVVSVGGWIVGKLTEGIQAVASFAANVGGWIKNRVVEGVHGFAEGFTELGGWVIGKIVNAAKAVGGIGAEIGGFLKDKIAGGVREVAESFINIGGDIISGIAKGIRDGAGSIIRAIKEAVVDALPKFVRKALKIKSPSRVFMDLGRQVSLGMAQGIASEAGRVQRAMQDMSAVPGVSHGTVGAMGYVTPAQAPVKSPSVPATAGVTIMGDLVVQDRSDADTVAARLAWLMANG